jgi:hypothetical protein
MAAIADKLSPIISRLLGVVVPATATGAAYGTLRQNDRDLKTVLDQLQLRMHGRLTGNVKHEQTLDKFIDSTMARNNVSRTTRREYAKNFAKRIRDLKASGKADLGWAFDPDTRTLISGFTGKPYNSGVLAHELGHSQQEFAKNPVGSGIYGASKAAPILYALMGKPTTAGRAGLASVLLGAPMLLTEMDASRRGSQLLKRYTDDSPATSWLGIPSYTALAATPMAAYGSNKYLTPKIKQVLMGLLKKVR